MKLLERLLYEPQHENKEKVTDQALTRSIVISVIGILFCMTCLFGLTWAWFSYSIVTSSNKITAATFDLDITITEQGAGDTVTKGEDGYYALDAAKTYTVSLAKQGTAKTGFCHLSVITPTAATATVYYTDSIPQIDEATETETEPFVFTLSGVSKIKFTAMWGQCPEDHQDKVVQYNDTLSLGAVSMTPPAAKQNEETKTEETTAPTKTTTPTTTEKKQPESTAPSTEPTTPESTTGAETTNVTETTNPPETTDSPETTDTPETTQAESSVTEQSEPSDTEKAEPTEPSAQTEPTEP